MRHSWLMCDTPDLPLRAFRKSLFSDRPETLEGGKGGGAPQAPDPYVVANATTQTNQATAAYNKALNLNNSSGPFGSQQSNIVGTDPTTGAPIYNTNISASAPLQGLINSSLGAAGNSNNVLNGALYGLGGLSSQISPTAAQDANQQGRQAAYAAQTQYLDPRFSQEQTSLESQLANQGLTPGSQAYDNAMKNFNLSKNQAYSDAGNQSILTGSQIGTQMLQNQLATAGEKANLYGQQASLSQLPYSQLSSLAALIPGNSGTAQSAASPANIAQSFQNQYQGQLNSYNSNVASQNSTMGGLFGLGGAGMMALALSDRRTKTDIEAIAPLKDGVNLYRFRYRFDPPGTVRHGLMADEVKRVDPSAVVRLPNGLDAVNYDRALGG